jgi:hypothetical protein
MQLSNQQAEKQLEHKILSKETTPSLDILQNNALPGLLS